jgi:hypothetical protein
MGYRGKVEEQERARVMRADGMTLLDIAQPLGVSSPVRQHRSGNGAFLLCVVAAVFAIDEARLRVCVYLHQGLDIDAAQGHWSQVTAVPLAQFGKAYRAVADPTIRRNKHEFGCVYVDYSCTTTHRRIMGLVRALLSWGVLPG